MARIDRVACCALLALALGGHLLVERAALALDPALCVSLAWERSGTGPAWSRLKLQPLSDGKVISCTVLVLEVIVPAQPRGVDGRLVPDPWGWAFRWDAPFTSARGASRCWLGQDEPIRPRSLGPDGVTSADDIAPRPSTEWPLWQRVAVARPRLASLLIVAYLALAWSALRRWRVGSVQRDVR